MRFLFICAALGCAVLCASASAEFKTFDEVPQVYTSHPQRFANLFRSAETGTLRLGVLGDSQETSPGGGGRFYIPSLTHGFWQRYGNVPETQVAPNANEIEFLHRTASAGGVTTRVQASRLPPGVGAKAHSTLGAGGATGSSYGSLFTLQHDAVETHDATLRGYPYMDVSAGVRLEVLAATNNSSGEVAWQTSRATPRARVTSNPSFRAASVQWASSHHRLA